MKTKVGFIGFGLIAGSLAHALKESGRDYHITATSRHLEPVIAAVADGIVDVAAPAVDETFAQCDIILLRASPAMTRMWLPPFAFRFMYLYIIVKTPCFVKARVALRPQVC